MTLPTAQEFIDAKRDLDDMAEVVNSAEIKDVSLREGKSSPTLAKVIKRLNDHAPVRNRGLRLAGAMYETNDIWKSSDGVWYVVNEEYVADEAEHIDIASKKVFVYQAVIITDSVRTLSDLRLFNPGKGGHRVYVLGHTEPGIGGGWFWYNDMAPTLLDDGGVFIVTAKKKQFERAGAVEVSFEDYGALEGKESSSAIEAAINSGIPVRNRKRSAPYVISREVVVTANDVSGQQTKLLFSSKLVERGLVFTTTSGLRLCGFVFTTSGTVDQFVNGASGADIRIEYNTFDHAGCTARMLANSGGVRLSTVSDTLIRRNKFKNGWRDKEFHAGRVGGNNLYRSVDIQNAGEETVKLIDNQYDDVWSAAYVSNTNNLHFIRNKVKNTADTAFFDRCTALVTKLKRFRDNEFKNIGKAAIKTLDTNNNNDLVWGEDSIIEGNKIENWGLLVESEAVLAARGFDGSYKRSSVKAKKLRLLDNEFEQTVSGLTSNAFKFINIDDVIVFDNNINPMDSVGDAQLLSNYCSNFRVISNEWKLNGYLQLSFAHEGRYLFDDNEVYCTQALSIGHAVNGKSQRFKLVNNDVINTESVITGHVYGVRVFSINEKFSIIATQNTFQTAIQFQDSNQVGSNNLFGLPANAAAVLDNNIVEFSDRSVVQKMIAGDILNPVYYQGLAGAVRNNGVNGMQYKATNKRSGDVFTIDQS